MYRYKRICLLARCARPFGTNKENQKFCEPDHQVEYNRIQKKEVAEMARRLNVLETEIRKMKFGFVNIGQTIISPARPEKKKIKK